MARHALPTKALPATDILDTLAGYRTDDADYRGGRTWSLVYHVEGTHEELVAQAGELFLESNFLNPMAFKSLKRIERELVDVAVGLMHGPSTATGCATSGGTESLLLAVLSARDDARRRRPWIRRPNIVLPATAHVAFDKAAHLFGLRLKKVRVGADGAVDVRAFRRAIDRNTVLLVGSAPQYAHGTIDPIAELGAIAVKKGLRLHVDACFGGWMSPFLERLGVAIPPWDFRVPGVSSISADLHKYGYAPKGISLLLYRDVELLKPQIFVATDFPGGIYASPGLLGSRPGFPMAAAWASVHGQGEEGLLALAKEAWTAAERLRAGILAIPQLRLLGAGHHTIVTWGARDGAVDVYAVADAMTRRGWHVDRQQLPPSVHLTVNANNLPVVDRYLEDLRASVAEAVANPDAANEGEAATYGTMARLPARGLVKSAVADVIARSYDPTAPEQDLTEPPEGLMGKAMAVMPRLLRRWERLVGERA
ncbi:MAG: aspartate aminotransferase family protein [Alphaproteobacteria bacterium]|nr:aspartate aminotransferase family protein [Alphaproteobacteria bacterium]MCB9698663.1 aspartate aminotransferase family protein [Alphaproteobacteria bacterium]